MATSRVTLRILPSSNNSGRSKAQLTQKLRQNSAPSLRVSERSNANQSALTSNQNQRQDIQQHDEKLIETRFRQTYSCPRSDKYKDISSQPLTPDVAAYVLQPDGSMAAVSWQDKSALESNKQLMATLKDEQHAQRLGRTTGRVQNTSNVGRKLPAEMLDWLASADGSSSRQSEQRDVHQGVVSPQSARISSNTQQRVDRVDTVTQRQTVSHLASRPSPEKRIGSRTESDTSHGRALSPPATTSAQFRKTTQNEQTRNQKHMTSPVRSPTNRNGDFSSPVRSPTNRNGEFSSPVRSPTNRNGDFSSPVRSPTNRNGGFSSPVRSPTNKKVSNYDERWSTSSQVQHSYWVPTAPQRTSHSPEMISQTRLIPSSQMPTGQFSSAQKQFGHDIVTSATWQTSPHLASRTMSYDCDYQNTNHQYKPVWDYFHYPERCATSDL